MGYGDDELFGVGNDVAVAVFAGDFCVCGDAGDAFQPVTGGEGGVVGGAAGENFDAADAAEYAFCVCAEIACFKAAFQKDFGGVGNGARLLVDFFLHEVAVWPKFQ